MQPIAHQTRLNQEVLSVGCFAFAASAEYVADTSSYFAKLSAALERIENLTNLSVEGIDSGFGDLLVVHKSDEELFVPHPYDAEICFNLYIPFKTQDALGFPCAVEHFEVHIIHHYHFPVAYVSTVSSHGIDCSDTAGKIALVREYFCSKFKDDEITFFYQGPSPFHATFRAIISDRGTEISDSELGVGYRQYECNYNPAEGDFLTYFSGKYGIVLSLFYALQTIRSDILSNERVISAGLARLIEPPDGMRQKLRSITERRSIIDDVQRAIFENERYRSYIRHELDNAEETLPNEHFLGLKYHFFELMKSAEKENYTSGRQIIQTAESRGLAIIQNSAVVISGLVGGLIGAFITSVLSG